MKNSPIPLARILPALLLFAFFFLTTPARAVVTLTFSQRGNDVVITLSGSTTIAGLLSDGTGVSKRFSTDFMVHHPGTQHRYTGLQFTGTLPIVDGVFDASSTASTFGIGDRSISFDASLSNGSTWAPTGELVIKNHTYMTLFGTNTPIGPRGNWVTRPPVQAVTSVFIPVPEPSAALLATLGLGTLISRRRRF